MRKVNRHPSLKKGEPMTKLVDIEGIGPVYAKKLLNAGVRSLGDFLRKGATPKGRQEIAKASGIGGKLILEWVNHADLFRIKGVASEYSDLLEAAGVDTVVELSKRDAKKLVVTLAEVSKKKNLTNRVPNEKQVKNWIAQAKKLPRAISY
jgi:predicted flap endonuclease-1-like 5' DNA nuclease